MSFRRRMVLLASAAVAAAVVIASVVVYVVTRDELRKQVDSSLRQRLQPGGPSSVQVQAEYIGTAKGKGGAVGIASGALPQPFLQWGPNVADRENRTFSGADTARALPQPNAASSSASSKSAVVTANGPIGPGGSEGGFVAAAPRSLSALGRGGPTPRVLVRGKAFSGLPLFGSSQRVTDIKVVLPEQKLGGATGFAQLVQPGGQVLRSDGTGTALPVTSATRAVANGRQAAFFSDATIAGTHVRVLTEKAPIPGAAWQVALPLSNLDTTLANLKLVLAIVSLGGIALAAAFGLLVSRAALAPVRRLTGAAERVARTQDLGHRIATDDRDELGRLARSFNTMLAALERSRLAQRQLVSDASHELRTPLTSVQANLDALAMGERLPARDRERAVAAAQAQLRELTVLVGDLVDLSKTDAEAIEVEEIRLDLAVAGAVERARLHAPRCRFLLDAAPCLVRAAPAALDRAIANLLDNAVKWGPQIGPVEVRVADGNVDVRDHGPGIAAEDLPRVFDRFYRAASARALPGSGLGLAIVRKVAETHGGAVQAANDADGGARLTLELPALPMSSSDVTPPALDHEAVHQAPPPL